MILPQGVCFSCGLKTRPLKASIGGTESSDDGCLSTEQCLARRTVLEVFQDSLGDNGSPALGRRRICLLTQLASSPHPKQPSAIDKSRRGRDYPRNKYKFSFSVATSPRN